MRTRPPCAVNASSPRRIGNRARRLLPAGIALGATLGPVVVLDLVVRTASRAVPASRRLRLTGRCRRAGDGVPQLVDAHPRAAPHPEPARLALELAAAPCAPALHDERG